MFNVYMYATWIKIQKCKKRELVTLTFEKSTNGGTDILKLELIHISLVNNFFLERFSPEKKLE